MAEITNGNGKAMWPAIIGGISAIAVIIAIFTSMISPVNSQVQENIRRIEKVETWQDDYAKGKIPSSAERELAAMRVMFTEVETQFRMGKELQAERNRQFEKSIDEYRNLLDRLAQIELFMKAKLKYNP